MSYTLINLLASSITNKKQKGFVKPKKGVKVKCNINRQEGDDDDGFFVNTLTIAEVKIQKEYYYIRYEEINSDEWDEIHSSFYVKKEK